MKTIKKTLHDAIGTGELINIIYSAGSEPGTSRMIMPFKFKDDKIMAKCYMSNTVKTYFLEKITLDKSDKTTYTGNQKRPKTLIKAVKPNMDKLNKFSWEIDSNKVLILLKVVGKFISYARHRRIKSN